jgi:hypothetical protein
MEALVAHRREGAQPEALATALASPGLMTPYPLPTGSRLLQDLGFLPFTLDHVESIMPTRKPRGRALTRAQKAAHRRIARRRVRIEHVNSSVKRCRIVHDTCHLRKADIRDLIMEVCCALHNFRVRLSPWQPMV